ncbi:MAG: phosphoenolpyruvate carboxylase, partial [Pseudomonadota bacterium]
MDQLTAQSSKQSLRDYARNISADPQTNSVFAYARQLFRQLETGETDLAALDTLIHEVGFGLSLKRADAFRSQHAGADPDQSWQPVAQRLNALAEQGWDAFKQAVETAAGGIVFTAHPTFAQSKQVRAAFAHHVTADNADSQAGLAEALKPDGRDWSASISLAGEHEEVQEAIATARLALRRYASLVVDTAQSHFPDRWTTLRLHVPTLASWVGYDLDGRSDIHWSQSITFRLREKAAQLRSYAETINQLVARAPGETALAQLAARLLAACARTDEEAALFAKDLTDPDNLPPAANALTEDHPDHLTDAREILDTLETVIGSLKDDDLAADLLVLHAEVEALQLGTARIHLRLNAAQIRTVISRDLGLETEDRELGRRALSELSRKAGDKAVRPINFADLFLEQSTARRQFMMCAQFLKHIDAGSNIRFLIAESENPATVMGALYLARQYGVDDKLDISPLFETPEALETGGRFVARLLEEPEFLAYARTRGYLSIQLGFSDAGRFIGQIAADMAIERIHNLISRAVCVKDPSLGLLIFNTHGESMGRGAWPGTFTQRFNHLMTPWTRANCKARGIALKHEVSFQGGDGFLHFATQPLADATYAAACEHLLSEPREDEDDPFYVRTDLVWDFYRSLRRWHETLFQNEDYARLLGDFATNLLVTAGSRPRRRSSGPGGPRSLRAISHNATLQQLGIPLNTAAGIGSALRRENDQVAELIVQSPRMRSLMRLALNARIAMSVPALRAYANVYDPSFWVALAGQSDIEAATAYRRIYYRLQSGQTSRSLRTIADKLSVDLGKFDRLIDDVADKPAAPERHEGRLDIHILHAVRQALMMKAFALIAHIPSISGRHDASIEEIFDMVLEMRIKDTVNLLCR